MDNKLNEIRRKIKFLRAEMLGAEDNIRKRVNRDEDCSEAAHQHGDLLFRTARAAPIVTPQALDQMPDGNRSPPGKRQDLDQRARFATAQIVRRNAFDLELAENARANVHGAFPRPHSRCRVKANRLAV